VTVAPPGPWRWQFLDRDGGTALTVTAGRDFTDCRGGAALTVTVGLCGIAPAVAGQRSNDCDGRGGRGAALVVTVVLPRL
jgi:hypothetical protein